MKIYYRSLILALLIGLPMLITASEKPQNPKYEKSRTIKKEFNVNADALVNIDSKYGNVDVVTWNENRVVIEVKITVGGSNESKVIERLNKINVEFNASSSAVYARTVIHKVSSGWFGNNSNTNLQIDYKVKMPVTNRADLKNDYGTISLNELRGRAKINCDYGKIIIGSLYHEDNQINMDYTNNSVIEFINTGEINADYSDLTVGKAKRIELEADYTNTVFENIEALSFNCDYGKLEVGHANIVEGNGDYLTMRLGKIYKKLRIVADYGGIKVSKLMKGFENVRINTDYTGVKIGIDPGASFNFDVTLSYGGFDDDIDHIEYRKKVVKNTSKYYEGYVNDQNSEARITIDSDYGSVKWYNF
jgi:hypothetical protein